MEFKIKGGNKGANITVENQTTKNGIFYADVKLVLEKEEVPEQFMIT